ncbi:MAG: hypothetical protein WBA74_16270 [Cyclobacteriaceae bacterium]
MQVKSLEKFLKKLVPHRYYSKYVASDIMSPYQSVLAGPFKGMKYISASTGSKLYPKILGIYEKELEEVVTKLMERDYQKMINVGAAEGYFAVGFALKSGDIKVLAYEMEEKGRQNIKKLAALNNVLPKLEIKGECTVEELNKCVTADNLIVMDVEGAEDFLLDPATCPALIRTDILLEVHENKVPGVEQRIRKRFSDTHDIEEIDAVARTENDLDITFDLTADQKIFNAFTLGKFRKSVIKRLVDEYRPSQIKWFVMTRQST